MPSKLISPAVGQAVRKREPVVSAFPKSPAAGAFRALASRLWADPTDPEARAWPEDGPARLSA